MFHVSQEISVQLQQVSFNGVSPSNIIRDMDCPCKSRRQGPETLEYIVNCLKNLRRSKTRAKALEAAKREFKILNSVASMPFPNTAAINKLAKRSHDDLETLCKALAPFGDEFQIPLQGCGRNTITVVSSGPAECHSVSSGAPQIGLPRSTDRRQKLTEPKISQPLSLTVWLTNFRKSGRVERWVGRTEILRGFSIRQSPAGRSAISNAL